MPLLAVDLGHPEVGLRILGIRVGNDFVLLQSGVGLAIIHQVLGQAADRVQIVPVEFNRLPVGGDRVLVLLLLFVGVAESRVQFGRAGRVRDGTQHFAGASGVALFVVQIGQSGDRFFGIGLQLDRGLEFALRLLQIVVQPVEAAQQKVVVHVVGLDLDDLFVLLDGQLENILRTAVPPARRPANADKSGLAGCGLPGCWGRA